MNDNPSRRDESAESPVPNSMLTDVFGVPHTHCDLHAWLTRTPDTPLAQPATVQPGPGPEAEPTGGGWRFWPRGLAAATLASAFLAGLLLLLNLTATDWMGERFYGSVMRLIEPLEVFCEIRQPRSTAHEFERDGIELGPKARHLYDGWLAGKYARMTGSRDPYRVHPFPSSEAMMAERRLAFDDFNHWQSTGTGKRAQQEVEYRIFLFNFASYLLAFAAVGLLVSVIAGRRDNRARRRDCLAAALIAAVLLPALCVAAFRNSGPSRPSEDRTSEDALLVDLGRDAQRDSTERPREPEPFPSFPSETAPPPGAMVERREHGTLSGSDLRFLTGKYYDTYTFAGQAGSRVRIDLRSTDFDTFLALRSPGGRDWENDDHEGTHSRILVVLPESGQYTLWVTSFNPDETGVYELVIGPDGDRQQGRLAQDNDRLDSGEFFNRFIFYGEAGMPIQLDLHSEGFDSVLILLPPSREQWHNDDFEGNMKHSRLTGVLPVTGQYVVIVTSYSPGETGSYELITVGAALTPDPPGNIRR